MSSDRFDDNQNLPPWLRDVPLPPRPSAAATPPPAASPPAPAAALPEWLRELKDDAPATQPPAPSEAAPAASELPDWLRELGGDQPPPAATAAPPEGPLAAPAEPLPDWLREAQPAAPAEPAAPLPDWLRDTSAPDAQPLAGDTAVPDWLRAAQETTPLAAETPAAPDWPSPPQPNEPAPEAGSGIPSWLADLSDDSTPAKPSEAELWLDDEARAPEQPAPAPAELPAWLNPAATPAEPAAPDAGAGSAPEDGLPGWLSEPAEQADPTESLAPFSLDEPADTSGRAAPPGGSSWIASDIGAATEEMPAWLSAAAAPSDGGEAPPADVPLWLQDRGDDATPPAPGQPPEPETPVPPAEDTPPWLTPGAPETPAAPDDSVPAWLREAALVEPPNLTPAAGEPGWLTPEPGQGSSPEAEEIPAWLREASAAPTPPAAEDAPAWLTPGAPEAPAEDAPAWLTPGAPEAPETPAEDAPPWLAAADTPAPPPAGDDLPAWLRDEAPSAPAAPAEPVFAAPAASQPAEPGATPADLPPWLRDEAGEPLPMAAAPGDANLPTWLHGASADAPPAPAAEGSGIPGWLSESAPAASQPSATNELVGGVELPPWLRPPEAEQPKDEINPTDARSLDWLTRLGAQDDDSEVAAATPQVRLAPRPAITRTAAQVEAIALLERLAAQPFPAPAAAAAPAAPSIWQRVGVERLLYVVLLLAVVAALLLPTPNLLGLAGPPAAPGASDLFAQIDALSANDIVLVGYEWDARRSGELRPLEQAVIDHLIQHHVKLVLISTDSQGSLLLYDLRDRLGAAGYKPSGEDYILLGYKPGAELALRMIAQNFPAALASDFQGNDASTSLLATTPDRQQRLKTLSDFSMILVLGDEAADVQGWMEQVRPSAKRADGGYVPFGFVLPAETAPIVQPYLGQPNVLHLAGKQGALAYQQLRGDTAAPAAQVALETGQQRFSELLYLALLVIGAIAVGIHSAVTRGRSRT